MPQPTDVSNVCCVAIELSKSSWVSSLLSGPVRFTLFEGNFQKCVVVERNVADCAGLHERRAGGGAK